MKPHIATISASSQRAANSPRVRPLITGTSRIPDLWDRGGVCLGVGDAGCRNALIVASNRAH